MAGSRVGERMMNQQILVISSNEILIEKLRGGLRAAGFTQPPILLTGYPDSASIDSILESGPAPVAAVILDLAELSPSLRLIRKLKRAHPRVFSVVVDSNCRLSSIIRAKQSGAWGCLMPPYNLQPLAEHFQTGATMDRRGRPSRLISFIPAQGGNGASTVSLHVAEALSRKLQGQVLLTDFDFHCGAVAFQLRLKPKQTLFDALGDAELSGARWSELACRWRQLDVLVAPTSSAEMRPERLQRIPALLTAAKQVYRCVVADLPTAVFSSSIEIMKQSDLVYLICTPEITSLHLARRKVSQLDKLGVAKDRLRLLVNRVGSWGALEISHVSKLVGASLTWALENDYGAVSRAALEGGLISEKSGLALQLQELASQILDYEPAEDLARRQDSRAEPVVAEQLGKLATHLARERAGGPRDLARANSQATAPATSETPAKQPR